jgi:Z1 domain
MASFPTQDDVDTAADALYAKTKRGVTLEAARADLLRFLFREPEQKAALDAAYDRLKRQVGEVEGLRHPATLKGEHRPPWYLGPQPTDEFWPALKEFLTTVKKREPSVVDSIDGSSTKVVSCLDFPGSPQFNTRGLVVGYVQSGKTANFTAVVSKAADVGFRVFIVLSGLTNSLRKQTQERLGAELVRLRQHRWQTWTDLERDFGDYPFNIDAMLHGEHRHLAVIKKNGPRLRRLLRMLNDANPQLLAQCQVLVIDDECDQASVNASGSQAKLTAINRLLRDLLKKIPRVSYVGYTATPYANVLIDPTYEEDLYPRDFITALPMPPDYFGAERLFGRDLLDADPVPPKDSGLDMIRMVPDDDIPLLRPRSREDKDSFVLSITDTLAGAIRYYVLTTAAKCVRGLHDDHSCMLIHTTVYARTHANAAPVVQKFVDDLIHAIRRDDAAVLETLRTEWDAEIERVPASLFGLSPVPFDEILSELKKDENWPKVMVENSTSDTRLDFTLPARRYVVIGGNILARGLTIEGLVVSFFLRTAGQYDTLMQMGRWFGYRKGFEDLPRIWMTAEMAGYFREMATIEAEIRYDIEVYERDKLTPLQFAVRIRQLPDLEITARGKMADAVDCAMSFAGAHHQTRRFAHKDGTWLGDNWTAGSELLERIADKRSDARGPSHAFSGVPFTEIIRFLRKYKLHETHRQFSTDRLIEYITRQNEKDGSLKAWNVAVVSAEGGARSDTALGPLGHVETVSRAKLKLDGDADIKALMSRADVVVDMPKFDLSKDAGWKDLKRQRQAILGSRPLLLLYPIDRRSKPRDDSRTRIDLDAAGDVLGLGIIFPAPESAVPLGYKRAAIDSYLDEEPEYEEEKLPDDVGAA